MSMHSYPMADCGLYVDAEVAAYIRLCWDKKRNSVPQEIQTALDDAAAFRQAAREGTLPLEYCGDIGEVMYYHDWESENHPECILDMLHVTNFDGEIRTMLPERTAAPLSINLCEDEAVWLPANKGADLFKAAYSSPEELLEEFKTRMADLELPDDFDWWAHIIEINGSTFG